MIRLLSRFPKLHDDGAELRVWLRRGRASWTNLGSRQREHELADFVLTETFAWKPLYSNVAVSGWSVICIRLHANLPST